MKALTRAELQLQRQALRKLLEPLEAVVMSCGECTHFQAGWCGKFDAEPPAEARKTDIGCESWEHDFVPF